MPRQFANWFAMTIEEQPLSFRDSDRRHCRGNPYSVLNGKKQITALPRIMMIEERRFVFMYFVYILANTTNTAIYTGITNDLERRLWEHKNHVDSNSFTAKYHIEKLVYFEATSDVTAAIEREKQIKSWSRKKKNKLIEKKNPEWRDLLPQDTVF